MKTELCGIDFQSLGLHALYTTLNFHNGFKEFFQSFLERGFVSRIIALLFNNSTALYASFSFGCKLND